MRKKLLSVLLILAMLLSLLPATALAAGDLPNDDDNNGVIKISGAGTHTYTIASGEVKAYQIEIDANATVILTVNGALTAADCPAIVNHGTLTIQGSGTISAGGGSTAIENLGTLTVAADQNGGKLTVTGGAVSGGADAGPGTGGVGIMSGGEVTVKGGAVSGGANKGTGTGGAGIMITGGKLTVTGGTVSGGASTSGTKGDGITIAYGDGTVNVDISGGGISGNNALSFSGSGTAAASVSGGTFTGTASAVSGSAPEKFITGGVFSSSVGTYLDTTKYQEVEQPGGVWYVTEAGSTTQEPGHVARVGGTYYKSLNAAVIAASKDGTDTVSLVSDGSFTDNLVISKELKIELGQFAIISDAAVTVGKGGDLTIESVAKSGFVWGSGLQTIAVRDGGVLTVNGVTVYNSNESYEAVAILAEGGNTKVTIKAGGKVEAGEEGEEYDGGVGVSIGQGGSLEITGTGSAVTAMGHGGVGVRVMEGGSLTVTDGGSITAENGCAVYQPGIGNVDISGGKIKGKIGIAANAGQIVVTNSNIQATGTGEYEDVYAPEGTEGDGSFRPAGIVFDRLSSSSGAQRGFVTITGSEILAAAGKTAVLFTKDGVEATPKINEADITVTGDGSNTGVFSSSIRNFISNTAYPFEAKYKDAASGGARYCYYKDFSEAVNAVKASRDDGAVASLDEASSVHNIRFDRNDGTSNTAVGTLFVSYVIASDTVSHHYVSYGDDGTASQDWPSVKRTGYAFDGWYDSESGGNKIESLDGYLEKYGRNNSDVTLYARWTQNGAFAVGDDYYSSLTAAVQAASDSSATIYIHTMNSEVTIQEVPAEIPVDVCIKDLDHFTLNLGGKTLNFTNSKGLVVESSSDSGKASTVTIRNGTIASNDIAVTVKGSVTPGATLSPSVTLDGVKIKGGNYGVEVLGGEAAVKSGDEIEGQSGGVHVNGGKLTVEGGAKITSPAYGIEAARGTLTVGGGEISGTHALYLSGNSTTVHPTVSGGTFRSTAEGEPSVYIGPASGLEHFISGGTFLDKDGKADMLNKDYLVSGAMQLEEDGSVVSPDGVVTVTFDPNDGSLTPDKHENGEQTRKILKGGALPEDKWPGAERDDGVFLGWYTAKTDGEAVSVYYKFSNDTTLYAHWGYTITFDANGGTLTGDDEAVTNDKGMLEKAKWPADPKHDTLTFDRWYTGQGEAVDFAYYRFTEDTRVIANWGYRITFDPNGGALAEGDAGTVFTDEAGWLAEDKQPHDPTRSGFIFEGWYEVGEDTEAVDFDIPFEEDTTLLARWTRDPSLSVYIIDLDANGGMFKGGAYEGAYKITVDTDTDGKLPASKRPTPARDGHTFEGWYTVAEDTEAAQLIDFAYAFTEDTTIYAHWKEVPDDDDNSGDNSGGDSSGGDSSGGDSSGGDSSGGDSSDDADVSYSVWVAAASHGSVSPSPTSAKSGTTVKLTVRSDSDYTLNSIEIRPVKGTSIWLYPGDEPYSFKMPASDVTVYANFSLRSEYTFVPPQTPPQSQTQTNTQATLPASAFTPVTWRPAAVLKDVPANSWAYPAAQWAYQNGYLNTAADGTFRLNDTVSHMQIWRIMAQWLGEPSLDDNSVSQWARKSGAVRFGTASGAMTRQNMVEYLYQCYFLMGGNVSVSGNLIQYRDGQQIASGSAKNAWIWAVNKGIISGTTDGYLNPGKVLSRAEFASILMRLCQNG